MRPQVTQLTGKPKFRRRRQGHRLLARRLLDERNGAALRQSGRAKRAEICDRPRSDTTKIAFRGIGTIRNAIPVASSVKFAINPQPIHHYDPDMAKSLLSKAGLSSLKVSLSASDITFPGAVDAATIFAQSAAAAGIDITVVREPNDGYWNIFLMKKPFVASEWLGRSTAVGVLSLAYAANSSWNRTFWKPPRFNELLVAARSELDTDKRAAMCTECQQLIHDDGGLIKT